MRNLATKRTFTVILDVFPKVRLRFSKQRMLQKYDLLFKKDFS